ncbi:hypothetical protein JAAARDRAFT_57111 [Jaapia argillacea MUCL 33604]|uniref:MYND-type domain-containing protein n=1 Tax=Jaapia argillacea MUCL 33604 TaxID=933084 RepID=A0A067Q6Q2_9AGAM|nr:hypothetical protein JAAARDRAFT_57111 [Jaapia argillacea MUCL 33604]
MTASAGTLNELAKLAISRLSGASKGPRIDGQDVMHHANLLLKLTSIPHHELRDAIFSADVITIVTKSLVTISKEVNRNPSSTMRAAMVQLFIYLKTFLEARDGDIFVLQSITAGILPAFARCSPSFSELQVEDQQVVLSIISDILMKYLVYQSIANVTWDSMSTSGLGVRRLPEPAKEVFEEFRSHLMDQSLTSGTDRGDLSMACGNDECESRLVKNKLKKCANCQVVCYCSKQCQIVDWKQGNHRSVRRFKMNSRTPRKQVLRTFLEVTSGTCAATPLVRSHCLQQYSRSISRSYRTDFRLNHSLPSQIRSTVLLFPPHTEML